MLCLSQLSETAQRALLAAEILHKKNISCSIINMHILSHLIMIFLFAIKVKAAITVET